MGRYYSGDIEGKFWFGVQNSDDASFFGGEQSEPNYIEYCFNKEEHLKKIKDGLAMCKKELVTKKKMLDKFFKDHPNYSNTDIENETMIPSNNIPTLLQWYARLELGEKILKCVEDKGCCEFEAEL